MYLVIIYMHSMKTTSEEANTRVDVNNLYQNITEIAKNHQNVNKVTFEGRYMDWLVSSYKPVSKIERSVKCLMKISPYLEHVEFVSNSTPFTHYCNYQKTRLFEEWKTIKTITFRSKSSAGIFEFTHE